MKIQKSQIPVVILCGGLGTRLAEETETKPKPLVEIGGRPILWHVMKHYSHYGFQNFILCLGYKGHMIRDFFLNYDYNTQDVRVQLGGAKTIELLGRGPQEPENWSVTLADTGAHAMTGARIKRIEQYIQSDLFLLTYGDGVSDVNLDQLLEFHLKHKKLGTVSGVRPPSRFGELISEGDQVLRFSEKPEAGRGDSQMTGHINGGFFVLNKKFFNYLDSDDECVLEKKPLEQLATDRELTMFVHKGFWQCMDTMRDVSLLRELWADKRAPWKIWK